MNLYSTFKNHTIAAISTACGEAGISVVRVSGPDALKISDAMFASSSGAIPSKQKNRAILHGVIKTRESTLDEVILLIMKAPHSYTREDIVEIQTHGGAICARRVLRCVLENGATSAEPGEFTKRAFLNGRIDLVQAEAVLDLIQSRSERAAKSAIEQLEGNLSCVFNDIYNNLLIAASDLEASLDFSEDDITPDLFPAAVARLKTAEAEMQNALATWEEGHILREGALIVISGKPNTGKSTLLNTLLGKNRAIVSDTPGTTRDTIEESIVIQGIPMRLVDTAGLRNPESEIEAHGVKRALQYVEKADLQIHLLDASKPTNDEDNFLLQTLNFKKTIIGLNKSDLNTALYPDDYKNFTAISISCVTGAGIDLLKQGIIKKLGIASSGPGHAVISERHRNHLVTALPELNEALSLLESGCDETAVPAILKIRLASSCIGTIIGRNYCNDILDSIFSRFCIGK